MNKQAQEAIFSRKITKSSHLLISFNNVSVSRANFQRHLGISLDEKFNFNHYIEKKMVKAMKGIGVFKRLSKMFTRHSHLLRNK